MTEQTKETLTALAEILRTGANRRLDADGALSHDTGSFIMHAIANEIVIAVAASDALGRIASREYKGANGNDD